MNTFFRNITMTLLCATAMTPASYAAAPDGYYTTCEGKGAAALLTALREKVGPHTTVSYDGLFTLFNSSDVLPNGRLWDMYSTMEWVPGQKQCGNYKLVGDCYNREHSFPKSWFSKASPMYSDAFHLYPTDGKVNGQRSNYPYGECAGGTTLPSNGSIRALGRLGKSTFPGYTGTVFEPVDEYKGDFARSYFYMAAAYNDKIANWSSDMLARNAYPAFSTWAIDLLLKWHRQDPVSDKERDRNDAVYAAQHNRNPFIDQPEMAEYIWGDKKNERWSYSAGAVAAISTPASGSAIDFGTVAVGVARTIDINVRGSLLNAPVTVTVSGTAFSASATTLSAASVNSASGATLRLTALANAAGAMSGTLTLTSGTVSSTVTLSASALTGLPASAPTRISDISFMAHWTYIGNPDSNGCYRLTVKDADGNDIDTYPRSVPAVDEEYLVDELEPSTLYYYTISCPDLNLTSNVISVTTAAPIPSVQLLYDGDLYLSAAPGVRSDAAEVLLDIDNIDADITLSVSEPFALSTDKGVWTQSIIVSPDEDRFYLSLLSDTPGSFETTVEIRAGEYYNDETEIAGVVSADPTFLEDFEADATGNYSASSVKGSVCNWLLSNAGVYRIAKEAHDGTNYVRMGDSAASSLTMDGDKAHGIGIVTMWVAGWSAKDGGYEFDVDVSSDGLEWTTVGHAECEAPANSNHEYSQYTFTVNKSDASRMRIVQTYGKRFCIDDIAISDYSAGVIEGVAGDYHAWDSYCRDGLLVVELPADADVMICGADGIIYHNGTLPAGETTLSLPRGLYIVNVADFARRVLIR